MRKLFKKIKIFLFGYKVQYPQTLAEREMQEGIGRIADNYINFLDFQKRSYEKLNKILRKSPVKGKKIMVKLEYGNEKT